MLKFGRRGYFLFLISILIITGLVILLDIPVLRQLFGFVFLTFVPGFFLLYILKLHKLDSVEKIVLSVGLSVAFLMLFGLVVNGSLLAVGYARPLSTTSLLISFGTATIVLAIIAYVRNKGITLSFSNFKLNTGEKAFLIVPALLPLLSIAGMRLMNLTDSNALLMALLFLIPAYVIFISFSNRKVSKKVYPAAIFLIGISLLLMYSLRSNHIIAGDTHKEYFMLLATLDNLHWSQLGFGTLDACLSITLMPAIYQAFLNINPEFLFKLIFSLMASILPLVVYLLSKKYIGSFYGFLASVFFMSQIVFLWTPIYSRAVIAALFFALAIWVLFHDGISEFSKRALFIVFVASIIVSHYGVTYATFSALLLSWIGMQILFSITSRQKGLTTLPTGNPATEGDPPAFLSQGSPPHGSNRTAYKAAALKPSQTQLGRGITITVVALFLAMLFFWYSQMTGPSFVSGVRLTYHTFISWKWFLAEEASGQAVQAAFGKTYTYTAVPQRIEFVFSWLTIIFIATGVLTTIGRFKAMASIPQAGHKKPDFLLKRFEAEYLMLSIACCVLLVATVIFPLISKYYGDARVYFQMMVPLSIFFVIGGITVARYLKARPYWVILVILMPYFLCTTGAMCQVFGFPRAFTLNSEGPLYHQYTSDEASYAAKWIGGYSEEGITIYATSHSKNVLLSQGRIPYSQTDSSLIPRCEQGKQIDGYVYLRDSELVDGGLAAEYPDMFAEKSKIYSSGRSEVYK
jgi:uncharacterized membrane protein